ncbi:DUF1289 domain-containing protein [Kiloniella sp. b19]|uniref:DUF1289 domain-containing protein n=1 Tax=Kiloniella sp. GXU_MW_B19 TaxID=3141326 RepID=UPI0031DB6574
MPVPQDKAGDALSRDIAAAEDRAARRARRRARLAQKQDTTVPSPCVALCQMDNKTGLCVGCHRNIDEIREWMILTREEKLDILDKIESRR